MLHNKKVNQMRRRRVMAHAIHTHVCVPQSQIHRRCQIAENGVYTRSAAASC